MAMREIEFDNGAHHLNRIAGEVVVDLDTFSMPYSYGVARLVECENALFNLWHGKSQQVFESFCIGDEDEQRQYVALDEKLRVAHELLNAWFNGWEEN